MKKTLEYLSTFLYTIGTLGIVVTTCYAAFRESIICGSIILSIECIILSGILRIIIREKY